MLYIHTSNQLEQLKNQYAAVVKTPLNDVFKAETVVVQNAGMARWLSMEMAQTSGISANTEFLFPAEFMWGLLRLISPDIPEHSQCAPDTLRFHIFEELSNHFDDYPELHHYVLKPNNANKQQSENTDNKHRLNQLSVWELSCQSARLLDQYLFYRSEWIYEWENDNTNTNSDQNKNWSNHWQARLWNRCVKDKGLLHWLALQDQFSQNIEAIDTLLLAERISFFSMSALSPGYVELLGGIAKKTNIHIFIINPCEEVYWGDIRSPKSHAKLDGEEQTYTEIGNPLLASLGKQGQDFIDKLLEIPHQETSNIFADKSQESDTLLAQIQHDIYNLETPETNNNLENFDGSIQFNSCHTAMREVEVLHDQILAQLDADEDLAPSDIVVMMPDIEKYAPYIESVFTSSIAVNISGKKEQKIPFSIADRDPQNIFKIIQALNKLLALPDSRFDVEAVFELLEYDDLRKHFGLDQDQLNYCRELARATNIRWGISARSRQKNDLPNTEEHTWKYALDRMLLGYSLADTELGEQLFKSNRKLELLAYSEIEGSNALVLSNLKKFTDTIFAISDWQRESLTLDGWLVKTTKLIQQLIPENGPENNDQQRIFKALSDLQLKANLANFNQELSFSVYQKMLQQCLSEISANEKYLGYGITFCALVPMRSVPFKIVALMGMNDGEFPRQENRPSFDLTANQTRKGDRSRRDEDRYLFLESLLAARSKLIISYIGQSIKDNTDLAPSILVSELLDTVTLNSGIEAKGWIVKHPLQAFNTRYFSSKQQHKHPLFSYASQYLQLDSKQTQATIDEFITEPLQTLSDEYKQLTLNDLISFYKNPARAFLQTRFSIQTYDNDKELHTREPFEIETFKNRDIRNLILADCLVDYPSDCNDKKLIARAKGLLPYGQIGDEVYAKEKHTIEVFEEQLPEVESCSNKHISLSIGEFQLSATIDQLSSNGRYVKQVSKPYAGDYISLWLTHLCLNANVIDAITADSLYPQSQFHSPEKSFQLIPVDDSRQQLKQLLDYYWQGLHFPLAFFPKSSFALFSKNGKENSTDMSNKWNGSDQFSGEKDSFEHWLLHHNLILDKDNQAEEFMQISRDVFGKMFTSFVETNT